MKLFEIKYGNGFNGSRANMGSVLVIANDKTEAKEKLRDQYNVKVGHMGAVKELNVLV
jgi:hypothetical protein